MKYLKLILIIYFSLTFSSCDFDTNQSQNDVIVALIDDEKLTMNALDDKIKFQLYEQLYDIYLVRKIALDEMIEEKLLLKESVLKQIPIDSLLMTNVYVKITPASLDEFIINNDLQNGISDIDNPTHLVNTKTSYGRELVVTAMKNKLKDDYLSNLREKHSIKIKLEPPLTPKLKYNLTQFSLSEADNADAIDILFIGNYECGECRKQYSDYLKLIDKYRGVINFYFVLFSQFDKISNSLAICANEIGKIDKYNQAVFTGNRIDSLYYTQIYESIGGNLVDCVNTKISNIGVKNFDELTTKGVVGTPSLIIDGRLYVGNRDFESLNDYISNVLIVE